MTPSFYQKFDLIKRVLAALNARCDCKNSAITIEFIQRLDTETYNTSGDSIDLWERGC